MSLVKMMRVRRGWLGLLGLAIGMTLAPQAWGQARPYIGYTYPAGGQQGTTVPIRLGGQGLDDVEEVLCTGSGVTGKVMQYLRRLNPQEVQLLNEQLRELKKATTAVASAKATTAGADVPMMASEGAMMMSETTAGEKSVMPGAAESPQGLIARIERRTREYVQTPACASISSLVLAEVTIAPDAEPGAREIRLRTPRGVSNPLVFHVGQVPEFSRKPMITAPLQVLGKEAQSLRKRPVGEVEERITLPCTVNGQIASGEVNHYRFEARKGQRLVIATQGRGLIPYIADAVPGWFQPVVALYDAKGKELAFADDYRFKPDPVLLYAVPNDGEYVLTITDAIYRGREDFVYRITLGELPFVTSIFPLGGREGTPVAPTLKGWNLQGAELAVPPAGTGRGIHLVAANRRGVLSNRIPFAVDTLPDGFDKEPNNTESNAQPITLPLILNGRIDQPGDWDAFQLSGRSNDMVVAEVQARRLDSPLDSIIKFIDASGGLLASSDDREDLRAGVNTHHADSALMVRLPADGSYFVLIGDVARQGGEEYGYRLRVSAPQPDFALRVVPSSVSLRSKSTAALTIHALRRDGFTGPIRIALKEPPPGFSASPLMLQGTQTVARLALRCDLTATKDPVNLCIVGSARIGEKQIIREAVPAEDRMQAFLWRHLVPAQDLKALVFDPSYTPPPKRIASSLSLSSAATNAPASAPASAATNAAMATNATTAAKSALTSNIPVASNLGVANVPGPTNRAVVLAAAAPAKPKFTKQQIAGRLRQLKLLFEEGLLTEDFYCQRVAECEAAQ